MFSKVINKLGFSLIELLVTLAISTLVVSAVLIRFDSFDSVVVLKSIAYEVALTVREAQVFAVSATGDSSGVFDTPYGVHVDDSNRQRYILFEDSNGNAVYDSGEDLQIYTFNSKYQIVDLCVDGTCSRSNVTLVFQRPSFDPNINNGAGNTSATIQLGMVDDTSITFSVLVGLTGQVTVTSP